MNLKQTLSTFGVLLFSLLMGGTLGGIPVIIFAVIVIGGLYAITAKSLREWIIIFLMAVASALIVIWFFTALFGPPT